MAVGFENKITLHSFRKVKCLKDYSTTLSSDIYCLKILIITMKDGLLANTMTSELKKFDLQLCLVLILIFNSVVVKFMFKKQYRAESFIGCFNQKSEFSVN